MTAMSSSVSPSRESSDTREKVESVLPPTLFRLPDLTVATPESPMGSADSESEFEALANESFSRTDLPAASDDASTDDVTAAPIFEIRYDESHAGPPRHHQAKTANAHGANPNLAVDPPPEQLQSTQASEPATNRTAKTSPIRTTSTDSEPAPRSKLEKYGSRVVVAAALLLIASATWLMGRDDESGIGSADLAGDATSPTDASPEPLINDDASRVASHPTEAPSNVAKSNIVSATLGKPAQGTLTDDQYVTDANSADLQRSDSGGVEGLVTSSPSLAMDSTLAADAELVAAQKPDSSSDTTASAAITSAPATNMLGDEMLRENIPGDLATPRAAQQMTTPNVASVQQPAAATAIAPDTSGGTTIRTTATPKGVSDWLKYLPQPNMTAPAPGAASSLDPSQSPQQATATATPNDPYAAYQSYINGTVAADGGAGSTTNTEVTEPRARTALNPSAVNAYPQSYNQPTSFR